jgi:hypothetical protein
MGISARRAFGRKQMAVVATAALAFGGFVAIRTQSAAHAHESYVTMNMDCGALGGGVMSVAYTVNHTPEAGATAGQPFAIQVSSVASAPNAPQANLKTIALTIPKPAEVTGVGNITVSGGTFTKASQTATAAGLVLTLNANAGTTTKNLQVPDLNIPVDIPASSAGKVVAFQGPSKLDLGVAIGGVSIPVTCNADAANAPLLSIKPSATTPTEDPDHGDHDHGGPTTTTTTPRSSSKPPTTAKPTTTMMDHDHGGPTTTTRKPTTTTRGLPTTLPPTTRPTGLAGLFALLRQIICTLFRIGC